MKKIVLFLSFLLMSIGVWGTTATMTGLANASTCTVNSKSGIKVGTNSSGGSMKVTVGTNATTLDVYIAAWNGESPTITITPSNKVGITTITPTSDSGIKSNSPFTLSEDEETYHYTITLSNITETTDITFTGSSTNNKRRFVVWGAEYSSSSYTITAQSNNTSYGTVSIFNKVITGTPAAGCRYASPAYTVVSGTATVSQSGNDFTVTPSSNCTIQINFEPIPTYTLSFVNTSNPSDIPDGITDIENTEIDVTDKFANTNNACKKNGWEFAGWTDSENGKNIVTTVTLDQNHTLYALYKLVETSTDYVIDTLTYSNFNATTTTYTVTSNIACSSKARYYANTAKNGTSIQITDSRPANKIMPGIISTVSGGLLENIRIIWGSSTVANRWLKVYQSDTAYTSTNSLLHIRTDSIKNGTSEMKLQGKPYIGLRSKDNAIYLDTIFITWKIITESPTYSTSPKCYDAGISIAHWYENSVNFDIDDLGDSTEIVFYNATDTIIKKNWTQVSDGSYEVFRACLDTLKCTDMKLSTFKANDTACIRKYSIPIMISTTTSTLCDSCNVVILSGGQLNINKDTVSGDIIIYENGKLNIQTGKTYSINSLTMRKLEDNIPQLKIDGTLTSAKNTFDIEFRQSGGLWHYMTLPYTYNVSDIKLPNGSNGVHGTDFYIKRYNGERRGTGVQTQNWVYVGDNDLLKSGHGYLFAADTEGSKKRTLVFTYSTDSLDLEKEDRTISNLYAYGEQYGDNVTPNHKGWNMIGSPYLTSYSIEDFRHPIRVGELVEEIVDGMWTGRWTLSDTTISKLRYIVVPKDNGRSEYEQVLLSTQESIEPFTCYFIQVGQTTKSEPIINQSAIFEYTNQTLKAPARVETVNDAELYFEIELSSNNGENDKTGFLISNNFTDGYDMMDDLAKWYNTNYMTSSKPVIASQGNECELAYNALPDTTISNGVYITYFVKNPGDYTISISKLDDLGCIEHIYLCDALLSNWVDIKNENYIFTTNGGTNANRFMIQAIVNRIASTPTGIENNTLYDGVNKIFKNGVIYIIKNNKLYNLISSEVK